MTNDEILQAAKEAGATVYADTICVNDKDAHDFTERFAAIIERKTIERCAALISYEEYDGTKRYCFDDPKECAAAIRKLGE